MKPAIIQHTEYKRMLRARLNAYFPDKSEIQKEIAPLYRKFRDLDLSAVDRIMQSHYSDFGPIPWSPYCDIVSPTPFCQLGISTYQRPIRPVNSGSTFSKKRCRSCPPTTTV